MMKEEEKESSRYFDSQLSKKVTNGRESLRELVSKRHFMKREEGYKDAPMKIGGGTVWDILVGFNWYPFHDIFFLQKFILFFINVFFIKIHAFRVKSLWPFNPYLD